MTTNSLPADRLPVIRPRCAVNVRTSRPIVTVEAVPVRRRLGLAEWLIVAVIAFMAAGTLATSIL